MDKLVNVVSEFCLAQGLDKTYWLAYSGGLDSHVLLHALAKLRATYPLKLRAIYINHGLSKHAKNWAMHCQHVCADLNVEFQAQEITVPVAKGVSVEEAARDARYAVFFNVIKANNILLTAHHQNDQAETLLLQMLRGAGPKGLAAMSRVKSFAQGLHGRPFLNIPREDLQKYARQNQLNWIEDESNMNTQFSRNFIRHEVMPILKKRWPAVTQMLARSALHCANAQNMLELFAKQHLENVRGTKPNTLSVKKLLQLDAMQQANVMRLWFSEQSFALPSAIKMRQIQQDMLLAREDKQPHMTWQQVEMRRFRDDLFVMKKLPPHDATQVFVWDLSAPLQLPDRVLYAEECWQLGLSKSVSQVTIRFRQGGETCCLPGRKQHHELKKLFQEWGVLPWERNRIPLIYLEDKLVGVMGYFIYRDDVV